MRCIITCSDRKKPAQVLTEKRSGRSRITTNAKNRHLIVASNRNRKKEIAPTQTAELNSTSNICYDC